MWHLSLNRTVETGMIESIAAGEQNPSIVFLVQSSSPWQRNPFTLILGSRHHPGFLGEFRGQKRRPDSEFTKVILTSWQSIAQLLAFILNSVASVGILFA